MKKKVILAIFFSNNFLLALYASIPLSQAKNEKIYAIMITGKDVFHKSLAERSIISFLQQTYPNKHLIIINDGKYSLNAYNCETITEIKLRKKHILGALRNIGLKKIPLNAIYLQWDDDDWHHPELMKQQYEYMKKCSADGCILQHQILYYFKANSARISSRECGIEGTIMCRYNGDVFYPEEAKSEDTFFLLKYKKLYKIVSWDNPDFYYLRFVHGHNTWDDNHFQVDKFKNSQWILTQNSSNYLAEALTFYTDLNSK